MTDRAADRADVVTPFESRARRRPQMLIRLLFVGDRPDGRNHQIRLASTGLSKQNLRKCLTRAPSGSSAHVDRPPLLDVAPRRVARF
jgi:hypothetical protein